MAGLDPAIHVVIQENSSKSMCWRNAVDARLKAGHDNILSSRLASPSASLSLNRLVLLLASSFYAFEAAVGRIREFVTPERNATQTSAPVYLTVDLNIIRFSRTNIKRVVIEMTVISTLLFRVFEASTVDHESFFPTIIRKNRLFSSGSKSYAIAS